MVNAYKRIIAKETRPDLLLLYAIELPHSITPNIEPPNSLAMNKPISKTYLNQDFLFFFSGEFDVSDSTEGTATG